MDVLVKAVREQWETCTDVEHAMSKYLNLNKGQLKYFFGQKEEMLLVMAAETLKKQGVTARCLEDPDVAVPTHRRPKIPGVRAESTGLPTRLNAPRWTSRQVLRTEVEQAAVLHQGLRADLQ